VPLREREERTMQSRHIATFVLGLALLAAGTTATAVSGAPGASGSLNLDATLTLNSRIGECPAPPGMDDCAARTIQGPFPGLGVINGRYEFPVDSGGPKCSDTMGWAASYTIRLPVAGKGELVVVVAEGPCVDSDAIRTQTQAFTVVGGTGSYVGASGSGTLERALGEPTDTGRYGQERWRGTLSVAGLEFDTTAPTLSGARPRTVKARKGAKSARVVFTVTTQDDRDASVRVACTPRSGSRFPVGKTRVTCTAVDTSANSATATFAVTVKRTR
jgi:HYR domain